MNTDIRSISLGRLALEQAPFCAVSLLIAELFYKLHSFTLEIFAFAATWYLLAVTAGKLRRLLGLYRS